MTIVVVVVMVGLILLSNIHNLLRGKQETMIRLAQDSILQCTIPTDEINHPIKDHNVRSRMFLWTTIQSPYMIVS